ncbi:ABC transporter substrate-binding protein [Paraburkholderia madseniana]|uniref:ABC transporter substrate-binding protein n=1 Tax=Paraburkholderia madseniana TaxID=2599607 RepID=A0AAP5BGF7_9BURK|nr:MULTISPECIES: ABC transporter substrate-binding protein [Paraburkholderia]MCX4148219.1 ABC transporter substrate-binding protein [Paraburkholderia madseniana]MDN7151157.1 ABC transporter substrate-binding protein [Paraburkholderia sp. WS6]MDQ6410037.1 ABC transporter substrate-binding protein [Paraburkholderia madseniana]
MRLMSMLLATGLAIVVSPAFAADPVRIGVTTILSGPNADRGQSEQYGVELALQRINASGGVLGRPVEAFYADNAADPATGIAAAKRLIGQQHVSVLLGALATPVTRAVMPVANDAKVPFVIDISAGQEFVDAAGSGGYDYVFKTSPSDGDVASAMMQWLKARNVKRIVILADDNDFNRANAVAMEKAATAAHIETLASETVAKGTTDLVPSIERLKALRPDRIVTLLGASSAAFFRAYEQTGGGTPIAGRIDFTAAIANLSPQFVAAGALDRSAGISVFTPSAPDSGVQEFVASYREKYGLAPTQRSVLAFEATELVVDAIRRANSDDPVAIRQALRSTQMPSMLGGTFAIDEHNHAHVMMQIVGVRGGKLAVLEQVGK